MNTVKSFAKTNKCPAWTTLSAAGGGDTLPTDLSAPTATAEKFEGQHNGLMLRVDFNVSDGAVDLYLYGWLADGGEGVQLCDPIHVAAGGQAGTGVYRAVLETIDLYGFTTVAAYRQNIAGTGSPTAAIYAAPL